MSYLTQVDLEKLGLRRLGDNVKISDSAAIHNADQLEIGDNSRIDDYCVISGKVTLGRNVHIAVFNNLAGGICGIVVESFSGISYGCNVFTQSDDYTGQYMTGPTLPADYTKVRADPISIGRHCILGAGTIVMPGVDIGEGVASGAATLFLKRAEPWSVYIGSPARRLRERRRDLLELEKAYLSEH